MRRHLLGHRDLDDVDNSANWRVEISTDVWRSGIACVIP